MRVIAKGRRSLLAGSLVCCLLLFSHSCSSPKRSTPLNQVRVGPSIELLDLGDQLFRQSKYRDAKHMYARAVSANGPNHAYVEACAQVARMESLTGHMSEGRPWLVLASTRATQDEPLGWSRFQMVLGIYEREAGANEAALQRFKELYDYCLERELFERAIDVAHHVVLASEDIDEQMLWSQKGIQAAEAGGMYSWLAVLWNNKGAALEDEGRYEDALIAYTRAREHHVQTGDKQRILIANWAVARAQRRSGALREARQLSTETLAPANARYVTDPTPSNAEWVGYCLWELAELDALDGDLQLGLGKFARARDSLLQAGIESWGDFGISELAKLDQRIAEIEAGSE